jgi:uncharacterized membrane protein YkvA (DUF1232 family)
VTLGAIPLLPWGALLAIVALYAALVLGLLIAGRRHHARALAGFVPDCVVLVRRLAADPETRWRDRVLLVALFAYLASPLDLVPDFVPVAGQLDDAVIIAVALHLLIRSRGEDAIRAAWPGPEGSLRALLRAAGMRPAARKGAATL